MIKLIMATIISAFLFLGTCTPINDAGATTPAATVEQAYSCKEGVTKVWIDSFGTSLMYFTHTENGMGDSAVLVFISEDGVERIVKVYTVAQGESLILEYINQGGSGHWTSCSESIQSKVDPDMWYTENSETCPSGYVYDVVTGEITGEAVSEKDFDTNEPEMCPLHFDLPSGLWISFSELFDRNGDGEYDDYQIIMSTKKWGEGLVLLEAGHTYVVSIFDPKKHEIVGYQVFTYVCDGTPSELEIIVEH